MWNALGAIDVCAFLSSDVCAAISNAFVFFSSSGVSFFSCLLEMKMVFKDYCVNSSLDRGDSEGIIDIFNRT